MDPRRSRKTPFRTQARAMERNQWRGPTVSVPPTGRRPLQPVHAAVVGQRLAPNTRGGWDLNPPSVLQLS